MKLSKLVYLCIKNVIKYSDPSFNEQTFIEGDFDNDSDYSTNINNIFTQVNLAVSRLSDLERIPYRIEEVKVTDGVVDLTTLKRQYKEIINVAVQINGVQLKVSHKVYDNKLYVGEYPYVKSCLIEYKEDVKEFDESDIYKEKLSEDGLPYREEVDTELRDYGIYNSMAYYIVEYVSGTLLESIAPELANMHITRAETYFVNLNPVQENLKQQRVTNTYKVGF